MDTPNSTPSHKNIVIKSTKGIDIFNVVWYSKFMSKEKTITSSVSGALTFEDVKKAVEALREASHMPPQPIVLMDWEVDAWIKMGWRFNSLNIVVSPESAAKIKEYEKQHDS